ncbi:hypothetical protein ACQ4PT_068592 [Festuca glaucescens]
MDIDSEDLGMKLMDMDSDHLRISDSEYQAIVRMPSSEFSSICKNLSNIGDTGYCSVHGLLSYLILLLIDTPNVCHVCLHDTSYCRGRSNRQAGTFEIIMKPSFEHGLRVPCCFREKLNSFLSANKWLGVKCLRGYKYDLFVRKTDIEFIICGPYWRQLLACYDVQPDDKLELFFDPEDLEVPGEYELEFTDHDKEPKKWAIPSAEPFLCKHVLEMNRPTLQKTVFTNITDVSAAKMCEVNWNIFKEIRFYYLLNKDEDFYELDQFFVHRIREEDLSLLVIPPEIAVGFDLPCNGTALLSSKLLDESIYGSYSYHKGQPIEVSHGWPELCAEAGIYDSLLSFAESSLFFVAQMECTEIDNVVHGACQGMGYTVLEPDDEDYMHTKVHTDTDFSQEMLVDEIRKFVKTISETCYIAKSYIESSSHINGNISDRLNSIIGNFIPQKVKNDICNCVQTHLNGESDHTCFTVEAVVLDVLRCITTADCLSGDTLKLNSSHEIISPDNVNAQNTTDDVVTRRNENDLHGQGMKRNLSNMISNEEAMAPTSSAASQSNKRPKLSKPSYASRIMHCRRLDLNETPVESSKGSAGREDNTKDSANTTMCKSKEPIKKLSNAADLKINRKEDLQADGNKGVGNVALSCSKSASFGHMEHKLKMLVVIVWKKFLKGFLKSKHLESPVPHVSSEWLLTPRSHGRNQVGCSRRPELENSDSSKSCLVGRKLFTESSEYHVNDGKRRTFSEFTNSVSPEVECLGERKACVAGKSSKIQCLGQASTSTAPTSPEVEFLGEICFNNVCNNMSDETDDLYNAGLSLGNRSVSSGKENRAPKRVITRSTYLCSPFENNSSYRVEPNEIKLYETITTLCDDPEYRE